MVYFKVTDGNVTRKFKVNPGEITYDQLKERLASLFPKSLQDGGQELHLKYRDSDGDIITISSNEEFQEALSELPSDHVWMLHIHGAQPQLMRQAASSDFFFRPSHSLFSDPWHGFGHPYHHHAHPHPPHPFSFPSPWLSQPHAHLHPHPWHPSPWTSLHKEFDKMLNEHTQLLNVLHNTEEGDTSAAESTEEGSQEGAVSQGASDGQVSASSAMGQLKIKNFGSWEPKSFDSPLGKGRIIGPVGYYVSWGSGPEEGKKSKEEPEGQQQEGGDGDTQPAAEEASKDVEEASKDMETDAQQ